MVQNMKENGRIIEPMDKESLYILMEIIMKDSGKMINKMVEEYFNQ